MKVKQHITNSYEDTYSLGQLFSQEINLGNTILLYGDLGAGKTAFVKGVLKAFKYKYDVTSPTFSLINEYDAIKKVIHIDCYREKNIERWINLGIMDYFNNSTNIVIIEWPEILEEIVPDNSVKIQFNHLGDDKREIIFI